jgi:hypothetical protein
MGRCAVSDLFLIWSNHHKRWWGPNGSGYRVDILDAGTYTLTDTAQWLTRGCDCCLVPEVPVPAPPAEVMANPYELRKYARYKPQVATRRAKLAGKVNQHFEAVAR